MLKKALLLVLFLVIGLSTTDFAQGQGRGRMTPEERAKQLAEQLKLDKDQTKKVTDIMTKSQEKIMDVFQNGGGFGDPETREKVTKLRDESNNEIMKLLNDTQKKEFKKILEEQRKRMEERRRNMGN